MIDKLTFLKPSKDNLGLYVPLGVLFFLLAIFDLISNSFFNKNITSFLPEILSPLSPLFFGFIGLHLIRIEYSGNRLLDSLNKNINSNWFNSILTLLLIFLLIVFIPVLLNWAFFVRLPLPLTLAERH